MRVTFEQFGTPLTPRELIILVTRCPELSASLNSTSCDPNRFGPPFSVVGQRTSFTELAGFAFQAGAALEDSRFRVILVIRARRVYVATGLDFREKNVLD